MGFFIYVFPAFVAIFCFRQKKGEKQKDFHSIGASGNGFLIVYDGLKNQPQNHFFI
jgi:hypothetical protein